MSYCVECGVELAEYHDKCPLCGTPVYNPNRKVNPSKSDYPEFKLHKSVPGRKRVIRRLTGFIISVSLLSSSLITLFIDFKTSGALSWSLYVLFAALFLFFGLAIPFFRKQNTFFSVFSLSWLSSALFITGVNLVADSGFTWSRYVLASMIFVWILMSGIFSTSKIRKFMPVLLVYILSSVAYFIILAYWISSSSTVFSLILPLEGVLLVVFLATYFIVRSGFHGVMNIIILILVDALVISVFFDLVITAYVFDKFAFTWSFIVVLTTLPLIAAAVIIKKRLRLQGILSKKLHR